MQMAFQHISGKLLVALLLLLGAAYITPALAQKEFQVGVRIIPQASFLLNGDDLGNDSLKIGFTPSYAAGIMLGQNFRRNWAFELNLLYASQGQNYTRTLATGGTRDSSVSLEYIKVPLMLKYRTNPDKRVMFTASLGPQLNFLIRARQYADGKQLPDTLTSKSFEVRDLYNPTDISVVAGLGIDVKLTQQLHLGIQARYDVSLMDAEDRSFKAAGRSMTFNSAVGLNVGLTYNFATKKQENTSGAAPATDSTAPAPVEKTEEAPKTEKVKADKKPKTGTNTKPAKQPKEKKPKTGTNTK